MLRDDQLDLDNTEAVNEFAHQHADDKDLVTKAIEHLIDLQQRETIRTNQRKINQREKRQKPYENHDWENLVVDGGLQKLTVPELDKYLVHHDLPTARKKKMDKIRCITCHISRSENGRVQGLVRQQTEPDSGEDEEKSSGESEAGMVAVEFGSSVQMKRWTVMRMMMALLRRVILLMTISSHVLIQAQSLPPVETHFIK